jgi:hypothetical protein
MNAQTTMQKQTHERLHPTNDRHSAATPQGCFTTRRIPYTDGHATQLMDTKTTLISAGVRGADAEVDRRNFLAALCKAIGLPQLESKPTPGSI